jgi:tRNA modification GTPase
LNLPSRHEIAALLEEVTADIRLLHDSFERGRLARSGLRAAIIGKPNAGKSSILNLLLGADRAIVTAIPGTTRDVIEDSIQVGPYSLLLGDTAGLREVMDEVERIGIERSRRHAAEADLVLAVFDSSQPFEREDSGVVEITNGRPGVAILNKRDLPPQLSAARLRQIGLKLPIVEFSAAAPFGIDQLRDALESAIEAMAGSPAGETVAISRERHRAALAHSLESLESARRAAVANMPPEIVAVDLNAASDALASITGEISTEDVLDAVFAKFCIGK